MLKTCSKDKHKTCLKRFYDRFEFGRKNVLRKSKKKLIYKRFLKNVFIGYNQKKKRFLFATWASKASNDVHHVYVAPMYQDKLDNVSANNMTFNNLKLKRTGLRINITRYTEEYYDVDLEKNQD